MSSDYMEGGEPSAQEVSRTALSRRQAMRAAVGGAAAVVVWSAPRIEGFSVVPDFASAASCTSSTKNAASWPLSRTGNCCWGSCSAMYCWNNGASIGCNYGCGGNVWGCSSTPTSGNLDIPKNPSGNISLSYALKGGVANSGQSDPTLNMSLNGMDAPFISCTVTVNGSCSGGGNFAGGYNSGALNANTTFAQLNPRCDSINWCNTNASLTISLSCTCA